MTNPKLTIILCGRNDQYGGDFVGRLKNSLDWNHQLAQKHQVPIQLVFVEYNPMPDRPLLFEMDFWPSSDFWESNTIQFRDESPSNLDEFRAKNIGLKEVRGEFVLVTNADILLPESLFMNFRQLDKNAFHLADRLNIREVEADWKGMIKTADEYCVRGGIFMRPKFIPHAIYYSLMPAYLMLRKLIYQILPFLLTQDEQFLLKYHFAASGDFMLAHKQVWAKLGGFRESIGETAHVDSLFLLKVISNGYEIKEISSPVLHQNHEHRYTFRKPNERMQKMFDLLLKEIGEFQRTGKPIVD